MRTTAAFLSLALLATFPGAWSAPPAAAQFRPDARVWVDNDREFFRHGDRLRVNFRTSADSYVAVVHVDPNGYLDFVYPRSPWDEEFVRGGRIHSLDRSGWGNGLLIRGGSGIGYLYVIASPVPLDYGRFRSGPGSAWDWSYAGRQVHGDPFFAMEQITRMLVPRWGNVPFAVDYYTYFVGGRQRYPSYACSGPGYGSGFGWGYGSHWSSYYGACDRLDYFLRDNPYYFDSRRYRGDRRSYYRNRYDDRDWDPRHAFKADPERPPARPATRLQAAPSSGVTSRTAPQPTETTRPSSRPVQRAAPASTPTRVAPAPERQAAPRPTGRATPAARPRATPPQRAQPTPEARPEARPRPAPAQRAPAQAARPEPRPTREAAPRAEPAQRSTSSSARASGSSGRGSSTATPRSRRGD